MSKTRPKPGLTSGPKHAPDLVGDMRRLRFIVRVLALSLVFGSLAFVIGGLILASLIESRGARIERVDRELNDGACLQLLYAPPDESYARALRSAHPTCPPPLPQRHPTSTRTKTATKTVTPKPSPSSAVPTLGAQPSFGSPEPTRVVTTPGPTRTRTVVVPTPPRRTVTRTAPAPSPSPSCRILGLLDCITL